MYKEITECRICKNKNLKNIFSLGNQYLTGTFPKNKNQEIAYGPVDLMKCVDGCGLVQLKQSYDPNLMYGMNYGYRSGLNNSMINHLKQIVNKIKSLVEFKKEDIVVDIGSNDSTTLQFYDKNLNLIGIDPTGIKFQKYYPEHIMLIPEFFNSKNLLNLINPQKAKVITSIAMFYDLEDPNLFMQEINKCLDEDGIWVFEQSYLGSMLEENAYDAICHEHLSYYAFKQIKWMIDKNNFKIIDIDFNDTNGGSFCIFAAKKSSSFKENKEKISLLEKYEKIKKFDDLNTYENFVVRVKKHKEELNKFINQCLDNNKKIYGYGASTKGNVIIQYCNITNEKIKKIAEVNEDKFGSYTPGSLIEIDSEQNIKKNNPDYLLVFPWHFKEAILTREKDFIDNGGKLVFPLPILEIVEKINV